MALYSVNIDPATGKATLFDSGEDGEYPRPLRTLPCYSYDGRAHFEAERDPHFSDPPGDWVVKIRTGDQLP